MDDRSLRPESLMMSFGYKPELSEGALKCPIFQTSTFVFRSAAEGKAFFEVAYGHREKGPGEELGLIYSRLNNPDLEILEGRLALWDGADDAAAFESGMAAIATVLFEFLKPGDVLVHSGPLYGGTHHFIKHVLSRVGVESYGFLPGQSVADILADLDRLGLRDRVAMIYIETPANPTNMLIRFKDIVSIAKQTGAPDRPVVTACDNTYLGPMWQHPLKHGIDIAIYSATKFIGGHSDVIAGSVCGSSEIIKRIKTLRTFMGNMAGPWTGWLLMRSLETLKVRTDRMASNARVVADFLASHPKVRKVYYLGHLQAGFPQHDIFAEQCESAGSMISFDIAGGEAEAFRFLDSLRLVRLAVSLGGTESLAEHPASMTHCDVDPCERLELGVTESLVRLSVGVEDANDLVADLKQALDAV